MCQFHPALWPGAEIPPAERRANSRSRAGERRVSTLRGIHRDMSDGCLSACTIPRGLHSPRSPDARSPARSPDDRSPANILYCNVRESSVLRPACCGVTPWLSLLSISSPESLSNGQHFRRDVRPRQARGFRPSQRKCWPSCTTLVCRSKLDAVSPRRCF